MYFGLAYYPTIENEDFHALRNRYEPYARVMKEHLAFVMPTPESIGRNVLEEHIHSVLRNWEPFTVQITGLFKSWDHWLMLGVKEGREQVMQLHDALYSGVMKPYLRVDLPFEPHVALGYFGKNEFDVFARVKHPPLDKPRYDAVLEMAKKMHFDFRSKVDRLTLIQFDNSFKHCENLRDFYLLE
jgi:2'-5' RNA ligase